MATPSLQTSVFKLAIAGEQAGLTIEQMIQMLNDGVSIEGLLRVIALRLGQPIVEDSRSSRWIM